MKKIAIVCLVGLFLSGILLDQSVLADVTADLSQAEGLYKSGRRDQAEQRYLKVIREADPNKSSDSDAVFTAAKGLSLVYIATDRLPQAKEAIRPLLKRPTPHALHEIVEEAKALKKLPQVHEVYQEMIAAQPNDPNVIWLKTGLGVANVYLADDKAVEATLQDIIANHGSDNRAAEAFGQVAWAYRKLQQYDKGLKINQYTVDNWPQKDRAAYAQQGIVASQIGLKDFASADKSIAVLIQKFGKDPDASKLVLWSGFGYQDANQTERACRVYELLVQNYPDTPEAVTGQLRLAVASIEAEDPNRMKQTVQTLVKQFAPTPDKAESLRIVANTLFWKRFGYANQPAKRDIVTTIDGHLLAIANYTLANWPKSDGALWAARDLGTAAIQRGDDATAQAAIARLTTDYADRKNTPAALIFLADQSSDLKKFGLADQIYKVIRDRWPKEKQAMLASAGRTRLRIAASDDQGADAAYKQLVADYARDANLPEVVLGIGEAYIDKSRELTPKITTKEKHEERTVPAAAQAQLRKALTVWASLTDQTSPQDEKTAAQAQYYTVLTYWQLGEFQNVLEQGAKLVQRWPDSSRTEEAYRLMVKAYKQQMREGKVTEAEGLAAIEQIDRQFLAKHPTSPAAASITQALHRFEEIAALKTEGGAK